VRRYCGKNREGLKNPLNMVDAQGIEPWTSRVKAYDSPNEPPSSLLTALTYPNNFQHDFSTFRNGCVG
jgi:hypothetical protein